MPPVSRSSPVSQPQPLTGLERLCLAALAIVFVLIVVGVTVRATGSGLGCPEWPRCDGSFVPRWEKHTLIEYSHRLTATIAGISVFAVAVAAWRGYRRSPAILYSATGAFILVLAQAGLGGATVLGELPPELVALHLATAMAIIPLLIVTTTAAFSQRQPLVRPAVKPAFGRLAALTAVALFAVMLVGSYVAGAGYTLACSGWPLCNGQFVPTANVASVEIHFLHRVLALAAGLLIVALVFSARREHGGSRLVWRLTLAVLGLYLIQALIGAANIWTEAKDVVQVAHLAVGTLLWSVAAYLNIRVHELHALWPARQRTGAAGPDLAGATR